MNVRTAACASLVACHVVIACTSSDSSPPPPLSTSGGGSSGAASSSGGSSGTSGSSSSGGGSGSGGVAAPGQIVMDIDGVHKVFDLETKATYLNATPPSEIATGRNDAGETIVVAASKTGGITTGSYVCALPSPNANIGFDGDGGHISFTVPQPCSIDVTAAGPDAGSTFIGTFAASTDAGPHVIKNGAFNVTVQ